MPVSHKLRNLDFMVFPRDSYCQQAKSCMSVRSFK